MSDPMALELEALAIGLARSAGELALDMAGSARATATTKSTITDVVTAADSAAEQLILSGIKSARPHDGVLGEEGTQIEGTSGVVWHVDPIDGTTNYLYGVPAFSVSIAAEVNDLIVAGAVYNPSLDRLYHATHGGGAWQGDTRLAATNKVDLATSLIATGFGYEPKRRQSQAEVLGQIIGQIRDIRRFGSAALDLCAVAAGEVDAYYERGLNRWDLAAGALIAAEAGATVQNLDGGGPDTNFVLASGSSLFAPLADLLRSAGADQGP